MHHDSNLMLDTDCSQPYSFSRPPFYLYEKEKKLEMIASGMPPSLASLLNWQTHEVMAWTTTQIVVQLTFSQLFMPNWVVHCQIGSSQDLWNTNPHHSFTGQWCSIDIWHHLQISAPCALIPEGEGESAVMAANSLWSHMSSQSGKNQRASLLGANYVQTLTSNFPYNYREKKNNFLSIWFITCHRLIMKGFGFSSPNPSL